ncbi:MAG: Uma2 family endonuclease [Spirochaetaceae bacterium]|nr:Uma2 family endonuclease [Spirochaetaceae bacterium]
MSSLLNAEPYYTIEDYYAIEDGGRYELYKGTLYAMASPNRQHQKISFELSRQIGNHLVDKTCEGYADLDTQLFEDEDTIVRPDLLVVCDENKFKGNGVVGAPDFIIEIASESTSGIDILRKRMLYERAGVKEYWIIIDKNTVITYRLNNNGRFEEEAYSGEKLVIPVKILKGLELNFENC